MKTVEPLTQEITTIDELVARDLKLHPQEATRGVVQEIPRLRPILVVDEVQVQGIRVLHNPVKEPKIEARTILVRDTLPVHLAVRLIPEVLHFVLLQETDRAQVLDQDLQEAAEEAPYQLVPDLAVQEVHPGLQEVLEALAAEARGVEINSTEPVLN